MSQTKYSLYIIIVFTFATSTLSESLVFPPYLHSYGIRKATPKHLFMFFGPRTSFDDPEGLAVARLNSWDDPKSTKDDDEVVVYGVNSGKHQIIFNTSMYSLGLYGSKGSGKDQFLFPKGIAANDGGDVYVADSGNNRIVRLFNPKSEIKWRGILSGNDRLKISGPSRIAIDEDGNVYANDCRLPRVIVFNSKGEVKTTFPTDSSFHAQTTITALAIADGLAKWSYYWGERNLYCADKKGTRLLKFDLNGKVVTSVDLPTGFSASYGATDYYHNYWVTDTKKSCILKYDHNLKLLDRFGSPGTEDNQFTEPRGITIYKRYGQVFIAEQKGAQYYWIGTDLKKASLKATGSSKFSLATEASEYSFVSLISVSNKDTTYYIKRKMVYPGNCSTDIIDNKIGSTEKLILKIEPTYSSYTYKAHFYPIKVLK